MKVLPRIEKIVIACGPTLDDFIFSLPAIDALRSSYSRAEIVLLGHRWHQEFLEGRNSSIDRVISAPQEGVNQLFTDLKLENFDLAVQLNHDDFLIDRLGAAYTVGVARDETCTLDRYIPYVHLQNIILRNLEVVGLVGASPVRFSSYILASERDIRRSLSLVPHHGLQMVFLQIGTEVPRRQWSLAKFFRLIKVLSDLGLYVIVNGRGDDLSEMAKLQRESQRPIHILDGDFSLSALTGLLSRCRLTISSMSGVLHLAQAVGCPTVGIYWCGDFPRSAPLQIEKHRTVVSWQLKCPQCGRNGILNPCHHFGSFVEDVPFKDVETSARELLQSPHTHTHTLAVKFSSEGVSPSEPRDVRQGLTWKMKGPST